MNPAEAEQNGPELHPRDGFTVTYFLTVADIDRSADFYARVFGGRIQSRGDSKGASGHIQIANTWLIVNVGGGFDNITVRIADIATYLAVLWGSAP